MEKNIKWIIIDYDERLSKLYIPIIREMKIGVILNTFLALEIKDPNIITLANIQENEIDIEDKKILTTLVLNKKIFNERQNDLNYLLKLYSKLNEVASRYNILAYITIDDAHWAYGFIVNLLKKFNIKTICYLHGSIFALNGVQREYVADIYLVHNNFTYNILRMDSIFKNKKIYVTGLLELDQINPIRYKKIYQNSNAFRIGFANTWFDNVEKNIINQDMINNLYDQISKYLNAGEFKFSIKEHPYAKNKLIYKEGIEIINNKKSFFGEVDIIVGHLSSIVINSTIHGIPYVQITDERLNVDLSPFDPQSSIIKVDSNDIADLLISLVKNDNDWFYDYIDKRYEYTINHYCKPNFDSLRKTLEVLKYELF